MFLKAHKFPRASLSELTVRILFWIMSADKPPRMLNGGYCLYFPIGNISSKPEENSNELRNRKKSNRTQLFKGEIILFNG